jgi:hypothetical protein
MMLIITPNKCRSGNQNPGLNRDLKIFSQTPEKKTDFIFEDILTPPQPLDGSKQLTRLVVRSCREQLEFWMRRGPPPGGPWTRAATVPACPPPPSVPQTRPLLLIDGETACVKCFYAERARTRGDGSVETVVREKTAQCLDVMDRPDEIGKEKFRKHFLYYCCCGSGTGSKPFFFI